MGAQLAIIASRRTISHFCPVLLPGDPSLRLRCGSAQDDAEETLRAL